MTKKRILSLSAVVILLAAAALGYRTWASNQSATAADIQTATVQRGSLTATLSASGNTRTGQSASLVWQTSGKVLQVTLRPGDAVLENQVLAELDPNSLSADMIKAKQDLITAQQALDDLLNSKLQQTQALQAVEEAQKALDSLKQQTAQELSQAQLALAQAQVAYDEALRNRIKMNYPHSTDKLVIEKAETDYLLAKAAYKEALQEYHKWEKKNLTNPERVRALNNLIAAKQRMDTAYATYNWYLMGYSQTDIAEAEAQLAVAQANLEAAQAEYDRLKNSRNTAAIALAEATLADAQRAYERVKNGPSAEEITAARAAVEAAQSTLARTQLRAPFAGTITQVSIKSGDLVSSGDTAFRIDDLSNIYVDLEISEVDLPSLKVGQQATIEFDAIPDKTYHGEVVEIGMVGTVTQGVVNYLVTVRITDADGDIRPGMTASVTIAVAQVDEALLVPNKAIRTIGGQSILTILFEGQQITLPVKVGLTNGTLSQVISDQLREGDTVVINASSTTTTTNAQNFRAFEGFGGPPPRLP